MKGIGSLKKRLEIQTNANSVDAGGGISSDFSTSQTVWGALKPLSGKEVFTQGQVQKNVTHEIIVRYNSSLTTANRIKFGTRLFNVRSVIDLEERGEYFKILAEEGVAT